jgi:cytochrome d ubiquinol oxidase subunit II
MSLNTLWFLLIGVLFAGYFLLEGFDYGVGILLPFIGKNDQERRAVIQTIGPVWDANEVWLLTAGGAIFAAFPEWYATMFSGFYLALFLMLVALIARGVAFEFRSKDQRQGWRSLFDWLIFFGSAVPALLWGVAIANLMEGVPIDAHMNYVGGFFNLLNPYALLGGLLTLLVFTLHGAIYLTLKTEGDLNARSRVGAYKVGWIATGVALLFVAYSILRTDMFRSAHVGMLPGIIAVLAGLSLISTRLFLDRRKEGWSFFSTSVAIVLVVASVFLTLFPNVMVSSLNAEWNLTIYNAASNPYSLHVMTIVAFSALPIVLAYLIWTYWIFRKRVSIDQVMHY